MHTEGLLLAQHIGINVFKVRTDCMQVVETMQDGGFSAIASSAIYGDCNNILTGFDRVLVEHRNREANVVEHKLARNAFVTHNSCIWDDDTPSFILNRS